MRGRKNPNAPPSNKSLPSCRVCGEAGTGFHYGVTTCGACKGFFRRSLTRLDPYPCLKNSMCNVGPNTRRRKMCPKCRYDKCLSVGMCKESCKVGRYSEAKKSKDKEEILEERGPASSLAQATTREEKPCQSEADSTSSPDSPGADNQSQGACGGLVPLHAMAMDEIDQSFSSDEGDDLYSQEFKAEPHGIHGINESEITHVRSSHFITHSPAPCVGDDMRSTSSYLNNSMDCTSMAVTPSSTDSGQATPYHSVHKNTNDSVTSDLLLDTSQFSSVSFQNDGTTNAHSIPTNIPVIQPFDVEIHNPTNHDCSSSSMQPESTQSFHDTSGQATQQTQYHHPDVNTTSNGSIPLDTTSIVTNIVTASIFSSYVNTPNDENTSLNSSSSIDHLIQTEERQAIDTMEINPCLSPTTASNYDERHVDSFSISTMWHSQNPFEGNYPNYTQLESDTLIPDTLGNITPEMSNSLIPCIETKDETKPRPFMLLVAPDPMKNIMSIFDQFPYKAFEKQSLAPLLKLCYDTNNWIDEFLPGAQQLQGIASTAHNPSHSFQMDSIESSLHSIEFPTSAQKDEDGDDNYLDSLFHYIQTRHVTYYGQESSFLSMEEGRKLLEIYNKICQLSDTLRGTLNFIDDDTYFKILKTTGLDADKRKEYFDYVVRHGFNESMVKDTNFYLGLPGFKELTLNDRMNLTRSTYLVVNALFCLDRSFDIENDIFIDHHRGRAIRISTYMRVSGFPSDLIKHVPMCYEAFRKVNMTHQEMVMLKAYYIMCPDFCDNLEDPQLVAKWNTVYLKCLVHHIRKTHGLNADDRLNKLYRVIATIKSVNRNIKDARYAVRDKIQNLVDAEKDLFREMFL